MLYRRTRPVASAQRLRGTASSSGRAGDRYGRRRRSAEIGRAGGPMPRVVRRGECGRLPDRRSDTPLEDRLAPVNHPLAAPGWDFLGEVRAIHHSALTAHCNRGTDVPLLATPCGGCRADDDLFASTLDVLGIAVPDESDGRLSSSWDGRLLRSAFGRSMPASRHREDRPCARGG